MDTLARTHTDKQAGSGREVGVATVASYLQVKLDQWQQENGHKGHVAAGGRWEGRRGLERDSTVSAGGRSFGTSRAGERVRG